MLSTPIQLGDQPALGITLRNITARKQSQRELLQDKQLLEELLNNIPDSIYFKDSESRFLRASASLVGWPVSDH